MTEQHNPLLTELKEPRAILELLTPEESQRLLQLLRRAKASEQRSLYAAVDDMLGAFPRLVRIPARKILFGR